MLTMANMHRPWEDSTEQKITTVDKKIDELSKVALKTNAILEYEPDNEYSECFYHRKNDCGYDIYTAKTKWVWPFRVTKIPVNFKCALPENTFGLITLRSSMYDKGIHVLNGAIDETYRGHPHIAAHRIGLLPKRIKAGSRIAQMIIIPYVEVMLVKTSIEMDTDRGTGKFGSTD